MTGADTIEGGNFSGDISLSGDTVLIESAFGPALAYVFVRSGEIWSEQAKLSPSGTVEATWSSPVSLFHDTALMIGRETDGAGNVFRAAYVVERSGTSWSERSKLVSSTADDEETFGWSGVVTRSFALITEPLYSENDGLAYIFGDHCSASHTQSNTVPSVLFPLLLKE